MEVRLEFLGQASVAIGIGDHEIVSDPWVVRRAQLGAWEAFPARTAADVAAQRTRVDRATHIYISHDHADHFDPEFLLQLAPKQLLVAPFHNAGMRRTLEMLASSRGHTLRVLAPGELLQLGSAGSARIIPEQPRFRTNSMLLVDTPIGALLNANDCGLNSAALAGIARRHRVRAFLYTLNFMANGYPFPYLRSDDPALIEKLDVVRDQVVESFRLAMDSLKPELSLAFAGPVTYPDRCNAHLNRHPEALDWQSMVAGLASSGRVVWPTPGTVIRFTDSGSSIALAGSWSEIIAASGSAPAAREGPHEQLDKQALEEAARGFLARVGGAIAQAGQKLDLALYLSVVSSRDELESGPTLGTLRLMLDAPGAIDWVDRLAEPYLQVTSTPSVLSGFLRGTITLDELLLSAYARFQRVPDVFHGTLHNFLRFGHDAEALAALLSWYKQRAESRVTIERQVAGQRHVIPKFCPHEGESLELANIVDGRLVCPRHKWCFELKSGACVAVGDPSVNLYQHVRST